MKQLMQNLLCPVARKSSARSSNCFIAFLKPGTFLYSPQIIRIPLTKSLRAFRWLRGIPNRASRVHVLCPDGER